MRYTSHEMHACEVHAREMYAHEVHAYEVRVSDSMDIDFHKVLASFYLSREVVAPSHTSSMWDILRPIDRQKNARLHRSHANENLNN
jgi:hypothetical protein